MASPMGKILKSCSNVLVGIAVFSFVINLLQLAVPLYSWQLFDRVLTSGSHETLLVLTVIAFGALMVVGGLEFIRSRALQHVAFWVDRVLGPRIIACEVEKASTGAGTTAHELRNLNTLRGFLTGAAVFNLFDVPWLPIFLAVIWLLHPLLGFVAVCGAICLIAVVVVSELATRNVINDANKHRADALEQSEANLRNAEVVQAMGMLPDLLWRWQDANERCLTSQGQANKRGATLLMVSRTLRMCLQVGILGTAAYLTTINEVSIGAVIAASTMLSRALSPVDRMTGTWQRVVTARAAYKALSRRLKQWNGEEEKTTLPPPQGALELNHVSMALPNAIRPVIDDVHFSMVAGERLGIVGPSGSGKSTLAKIMVGLQPVTAGEVRLDGADISEIPRQALGPHIGYLPQNVGLFRGTVRDNIARMSHADDDEVIAAAQFAGVHDVVLRLPNGYDTEISNNSSLLSGGQRQLIGLARAVFRMPRLLILDEPNANLDRDGETILLAMLDKLGQQGITTIVVTHRINVLQHVDWILKLRGGRVDLLGSRDEILRPREDANAAQAGMKPTDNAISTAGRAVQTGAD
ncbi:type I secretion system permease/ATPase [Aestuariispira ectoiniformans]|uniref:type I secretion system permease/ATPase n=1 Tax=Aestuariispira ectoiniformans TaxID=2775080 RepID=UPI0028830A0F|nr:type I secretion system permease/ATPase [Aestuariispira ectoiniformans]